MSPGGDLRGHASRVSALFDHDVTVAWWSTRLGVFLAAALGNWVMAAEGLRPEASVVGIWRRWDAAWFADLASSGYGSSGLENGSAFFPGVPLIMRGGLLLGIPAGVTGLALSAVAGYAAAVALGRLAKSYGASPSLTVWAWVLAPMAVFLAAPYTEALFCAFAFWAWWMAHQGRWAWAGLLAAGASAVRSNGAFLAMGLAVMVVCQRPRRLRHAAWLLLAAVPPILFFIYLWTSTGSWTEWSDAQRRGWGRSFAMPWEAVAGTWQMIWSPVQPGTQTIQFALELVALAVVLVAILVLVRMHRWPEVAYMGLTAAALVLQPSHEFGEGNRAVLEAGYRLLLVLFPIWILIGRAMARAPRLQPWVFVASGSCMVVGVIGFTHWKFIG